MKRLLLLLMFSACLATGYGQGGKTKQTTRLPLDSTAMQTSGKGRGMQVIDGSQNVQTRAGAYGAEGVQGAKDAEGTPQGTKDADGTSAYPGGAEDADGSSAYPDGQTSNPYAIASRRLLLPEKISMDSAVDVTRRLEESQHLEESQRMEEPQHRDETRRMEEPKPVFIERERDSAQV